MRNYVRKEQRRQKDSFRCASFWMHKQFFFLFTLKIHFMLLWMFWEYFKNILSFFRHKTSHFLLCTDRKKVDVNNAPTLKVSLQATSLHGIFIFLCFVCLFLNKHTWCAAIVLCLQFFLSYSLLSGLTILRKIFDSSVQQKFHVFDQALM